MSFESENFNMEQYIFKVLQKVGKEAARSARRDRKGFEVEVGRD